MTGPMACVLGGSMDLVRPLGVAGVRCAVVAPPGTPARYSRFTAAVVDGSSAVTDHALLAERLIAFGRAQSDRPVLFYESDSDLVLMCRHLERLREAFRFVVADPGLVAQLLDKERFDRLARHAGLRVPPTTVLDPGDDPVPPKDLDFPLIVKPLTRSDGLWTSIEPAKAVRVDTPDDLVALWPRLAALGRRVVAQRLIPGPETRVESYHVYVDADDAIAGEFTGRKIRTKPINYGDTTALTTTDAHDVATLGRSIVRRLGLRGVAKLDFKRAPDGTLHLLEINPRFSLWHHVGAAAGVNLPALVWADLTGRPRPPVTGPRPGVRWWHPRDVTVARQWGVPLTTWLPSVLRWETSGVIAWDDPMPFVRAGAWRLTRR